MQHFFAFRQKYRYFPISSVLSTPASVSGTPSVMAYSRIVLMNSLAVSIVQSDKEKYSHPVLAMCKYFSHSFCSSGRYPVYAAMSLIVAYAFFLCSMEICRPSSNLISACRILFSVSISSSCRSGMCTIRSVPCSVCRTFWISVSVCIHITLSFFVEQ